MQSGSRFHKMSGPLSFEQKYSIGQNILSNIIKEDWLFNSSPRDEHGRRL